MSHLYTKLILASGSPRRKALLSQLGFSFEVRSIPVDESFPPQLHGSAISEFICNTKASAILPTLAGDELALTADTVVCLGKEALNKAADAEEAKAMLRKLSGQTHEVITTFALISRVETLIVSDITKVVFRTLALEEIDYYIRTCSPYDKAGAYGIQEWIGLVAAEKIEGSFYTVMGLPTHLIYPLLRERLPNTP